MQENLLLNLGNLFQWECNVCVWLARPIITLSEEEWLRSTVASADTRQSNYYVWREEKSDRRWKEIQKQNEENSLSISWNTIYTQGNCRDRQVISSVCQFRPFTLRSKSLLLWMEKRKIQVEIQGRCRRVSRRVSRRDIWCLVSREKVTYTRRKSLPDNLFTQECEEKRREVETKASSKYYSHSSKTSQRLTLQSTRL